MINIDKRSCIQLRLNQQNIKTNRQGLSKRVRRCFIRSPEWNSGCFVPITSPSGWWFEPLWKIWVRQLGWLFPIYGKIKAMFSTPPTSHLMGYDYWFVEKIGHLKNSMVSRFSCHQNWPRRGRSGLNTILPSGNQTWQSKKHTSKTGKASTHGGELPCLTARGSRLPDSISNSLQPCETSSWLQLAIQNQLVNWWTIWNCHDLVWFWGRCWNLEPTWCWNREMKSIIRPQNSMELKIDSNAK